MIPILCWLGSGFLAFWVGMLPNSRSESGLVACSLLACVVLWVLALGLLIGRAMWA